MMRSDKAVARFLERESWRLARTIDLGTTAVVKVVERDGEQAALKTRREEASDGQALLVEYRVLRYLNSTTMRRYVPRVAEWLPELNGLLMEHLRYPTPAEKADAALLPELASALRRLHDLPLPTIQGLVDKGPDVGAALCRRWGTLFEMVWRSDDVWVGLSEGDTTKLERVRALYSTYADHLSQMSESLASTRAALTHGDLAGDNIMLKQDGHLAITDWGSTRIGAALVDAAGLSTTMDWAPDDVGRFYRLYLGDAADPDQEARRLLERLSRLHRYRACVQSLLWLNDETEGLDAVGRAHFERQFSALDRWG